jgi:RNA polymerase sigma factor (sigma-70 family)
MESERLARVSALDRSPEHVVDEMWLALLRLSPERRAVLVLRFYEDLPHAEIARIVGCPVATVRTRVRRALADLRKELGR